MGIFSGWNYLFRDHAQNNAQAVAQRATLEQFQTYPANSIQGRGTLVSQNGVTGGKYWDISQGAQVFAFHTGPTFNYIGAASPAGYLYGSPLLPNPDARGY